MLQVDGRDVELGEVTADGIAKVRLAGACGGCPMRLKMNDQKKTVVDPEKCRLSGECMKACPEKAIFVKDGKAVIDPGRCNLDGICIPACPNGAIKVIGQLPSRSTFC